MADSVKIKSYVMAFMNSILQAQKYLLFSSAIKDKLLFKIAWIITNAEG